MSRRQQIVNRSGPTRPPISIIYPAGIRISPTFSTRRHSDLAAIGVDTCVLITPPRFAYGLSIKSVQKLRAACMPKARIVVDCAVDERSHEKFSAQQTGPPSRVAFARCVIFLSRGLPCSSGSEARSRPRHSIDLASASITHRHTARPRIRATCRTNDSTSYSVSDDDLTDRQCACPLTTVCVVNVYGFRILGLGRRRSKIGTDCKQVLP